VYFDDLSAATFAVIDVETTGLDPKVDRVVEVACVRVSAGMVIDRFSSLVDPQRPIPARASAIHGIFDCDVAGAPTLERLEPLLCGLAADAVVVAHNARFDIGFLPFVAMRPRVCTIQLARRLVDAPSYRNEALRNFLRLRLPRTLGPAHRAACDAEVTAALLLELLRRYECGPYEPTVSALLAMIGRRVARARFAFGAHRGKTLTQVPTGYLQWIVDTGFENWPDVRHSAIVELRRRGRAVSWPNVA
jgi:DNA polymerase III epsilon subunit-like protein